jgi:hypothetical protein
MRGIDSLKSRELYSIGDGFWFSWGQFGRVSSQHRQPQEIGSNRSPLRSSLSLSLSLSSMLSLLSSYILPFLLVYLLSS